jgi:hypothetical protein
MPTQPGIDLEQVLARVLGDLSVPLARLAVSRGVKFPQVQELLKQAFVRAAREQHPGAGVRDISRVATTAGLTRREVARLSQHQPPARGERSSPATQLFTRWLAERKLRDSRGRARVLPRQGPPPSFEALARSVTRDVHPKRLLDELLRLKLVKHNERADTVRLIKDAFVPDGDDERMLDFLGRNVGDHFAAGVANVLGDERRHFEQALFVSGLTDESVEATKKLIQAQWRALSAALVPEIESMRAADRRARTRRNQRRLRVGLYSFDEIASDDDAP